MEAVLEVVVFPWLAVGHMIPFLELAERLAARGHAVSFVSTPGNLARLPPSPRLRFVPLPLPRVEVLPEGAESTADVVPGNGDDGLLKKAFDGLAAPFAAFLAGCERKPDWVINDFCHHWLPPIAHHHNVPCAVFWIVRVNTTGEHPPRTAPEDFTVPPSWMTPASSSAAAYHRHEAWWIVGTLSEDASGVSDMERTWRVLDACHLTIYRSSEEVEPRMFDLLTHLLKKPAVPAGILLPSSNIDNNDGSNSEGSVIYVALGSEAPLTGKDIHELALGLELAGVRFLWALRKPSGMFSSTDEQLLPTGFEERTRSQGLVCTGWVPQVRALAHDATGAFLTHCGWGSTAESLAFGHPLVMLPFVVDQPLIGRMMAAKGIGVEVARDGDNGGSFDRDGVAVAVRRVMVEDEGKVFASNAKLQELLTDQGRQERYMDELVEHLRRYKDDD
ncbi:hypothetical protein BRADI_3g15530v3 [Brachypodium distachyon]|uniref:Glycosyltransferase n=1 Tax=Brachypodium distachyon TaxID=15368 RepID=A0A0Q3I3K7_BRADI|nr:hypothetical protein BRADI_3g15530v3 [Brachypodium distachyon]